MRSVSMPKIMNTKIIYTSFLQNTPPESFNFLYRFSKQILHWQSHHRDYQYDVDHMIKVDKYLAIKDYYIHLIPSDESKPFLFTCKYVPIGKASDFQAVR